MKKKRILAMFLAGGVVPVAGSFSASAANTVNRKATDFQRLSTATAWYAEAVSAAVDNGLACTANPARSSTRTAT